MKTMFDALGGNAAVERREYRRYERRTGHSPKAFPFPFDGVVVLMLALLDAARGGGSFEKLGPSFFIAC